MQCREEPFLASLFDTFSSQCLVYIGNGSFCNNMWWAQGNLPKHFWLGGQPERRAGRGGWCWAAHPLALRSLGFSQLAWPELSGQPGPQETWL